MRVPPYAKWGKLAVEKTKEQYPKAEIIDYLHIGRKPKTVQITVENLNCGYVRTEKNTVFLLM